MTLALTRTVYRRLIQDHRKTSQVISEFLNRRKMTGLKKLVHTAGKEQEHWQDLISLKLSLTLGN